MTHENTNPVPPTTNTSPGEAQASSGDNIAIYSLKVVTERTGLGVTMVERCISYGIISPQIKVEDDSPTELYTENELRRLRKVRRLVQVVGLNWAGVEVVMRLSDELERLHQLLDT